MGQQFKSLTVDIGDVKAGSSKNIVEWEFAEITKSDIAYTVDKNGKIHYSVVPSCGCTADIKVTDTSIIAEYKDAGNHIGAINKKVTVYFKPEDESVPIQVTNEKGVKIYNKKLGAVTLFFNANVVK